MSEDPSFHGPAVEMVPGTLRGYRAWTPMRDWTLHSVITSYTWTRPNTSAAACFRGNETRCHDRSPTLGCGCGFYAYYNAISGYGYGDLIGSVKAHGKIILGTLGFRAEYMEIEALCSVDRGCYADAYGVPRFPTLEELLENFPPSNVTELIGA